MADVDDIRRRLEDIADELAEAALDDLRGAVRGEGGGEAERRLTRARRSVERAIAILGADGSDED